MADGPLSWWRIAAVNSSSALPFSQYFAELVAPPELLDVLAVGPTRKGDAVRSQEPHFSSSADALDAAEADVGFRDTAVVSADSIWGEDSEFVEAWFEAGEAADFFDDDELLELADDDLELVEC